MDAALRGADAPARQLRPTATKTLPGGTVVHRFRQEVGGVRVVAGGSVVIDTPAGAPQLLFDNSRGGLDAPGPTSVSRGSAIAAALAGVAGEQVEGRPSARQVVVGGDGGTLAWEVSVFTRRPADYLIRVDATSGEVISTVNQIRQATAQARLFVPNPVVANDGYGGLKDHKDENSNKLTHLREPVTLDNLKNGQTCLKGDWVNVKRSSKAKKVCKGSLDWSKVKRHNNRFEALMAYFHIDEAQQYMQTLDLGEPINAESQDVVVNSFSDDNSFYAPGRDRIETGTGGVDDGEDAEVIVHEYGHAVQFAQNHPAFSGGTSFDDAGAQGEGFGDYLSQAYSTEAVGFDNKWSHCVMEWDATSYDDASTPPPGICLRRTDNDNTLTEQEAECGDTEIHCIGEVWASALSDLRMELDVDGFDLSIMDRVVLTSHELLTPGPDFQQASEALIFADEDLYDAGDHCTEIRAELVARELLNPGYVCA
ncbi:MAG: M36 family metallopeptidase [bacterium]